MAAEAIGGKLQIGSEGQGNGGSEGACSSGRMENAKLWRLGQGRGRGKGMGGEGKVGFNEKTCTESRMQDTTIRYALYFGIHILMW